MMGDDLRPLTYFIFAYWHDSRFRNKPGGPVKVFELSSNLVKRGNKVLLFVPRLGFPHKQTSAITVQVPFIDLPVLRFVTFQLMCIVLMLRSLVTVRPDIIYVRIMWSFLPILIGRILSVPAVLEVNDNPYQNYASIENRLKEYTVRLLDRISFKLSDKLIVVTDLIKKQLHEYDRVPREKMEMIQSGANTKLFRPLQTAGCKQELGIEEHEFCVGFVGTFEANRGVDVLIDSAPIVLSTVSNVRFLIVGDGPARLELEKKVEKAGLGARFIFPGWVTYARVPEYIGAMDIAVAPLKRSCIESSAIKVFDYLSCGKPVILSDINSTGGYFMVSGGVELVEPEQPVDLAARIISLLKDPLRRETMGSKGREFAVKCASRDLVAARVAQISRGLIMEKMSRSDISGPRDSRSDSKSLGAS